MHDLKSLRDNPAAFDANWARRGLVPQTPAILELDEKRRDAQKYIQACQQKKNEIAKAIGQAKSKGEDVKELLENASVNNSMFDSTVENEKKLAEELNALLSSLPNMIADDVPNGEDENENVEVRTYGTPKNPNAEVPDHVAIGEALGMMDFEAAAKVAGARFSVNKGGIARLHRALGQLMLDTHTTEHGYTEIDPPLLVNDDVMYGTGQLPKFHDDQFGTTDGRWLIPTAEVVLTNLVREEILENFEAPIRMTAMTPSFRKEAGSAGKDTRGIIRQHQFYKVEMVSITRPEDSEAEHQRMLECAENILKKLELPFRTIVLCSGDMGFGARKTYDIEVWVPSQKKFREISSCSNCGDFQARRMKSRFKRPGAKDTEFVHTLNGSGLAVGRTLVAVMENYYDPADGGIFVPKALLPYMNGVTKIVKAA